MKTSQKYFRFYRILFIQITVMLIFLISLDLILNVFIERVGHKEFRIQKPEPYKNAEYFSAPFIQESFEQPGRWILDKNYGGVKPSNFKGKWINVQNNRRVTINKPKKYLNKIYLFGGSTVYNGEVPDSLTIASQLASLGANDFLFEVINMGSTSIHSTQQLGRLKSEVNLDNGDIVIFYDGVNDIFQRIIYENREGFMLGKPKQESFWINFLRTKSKYSSILYILYLQMSDNTKEISNNLIETSIGDYVNTLIKTNNYVVSKGAYFFHFLQPTLFTKKNLNQYEQMLIAKGPPFTGKQIKKVFTEVYPIIEEKIDNVNFSLSLVKVFDTLIDSPYFDFCHVNHIGNKIIAKNIWKNINDDLNF